MLPIEEEKTMLGGDSQKRAGAVVIPLIAASLLFAASTARADEKPIVIGASVSETGPLAVDAGYHLRGLQLGVADANAHGGWLGRKIELKYYDDQSNPGTAVRLYTRLITQDNVDLLVGPYSSGISQAVAPLTNKYQRATPMPGASLPSIFAPGNKWNFQLLAPATGYVEGILPMTKAAGAHNVAILQLQVAFTLACGKARLDQAKSLAMPVVYTTTYALPQPDFSAMALAIKNANPDVVVVCSYYPDAVGIAQALHRIGYAPKYLAETIGPAEAQFNNALGPIANRIISNTSWWPSLKTPDNAGFIARYKAMFHEDPDYHVASTYSAIQVMAAAVAGTKSLDQAKLRTWMLSHEVDTVQGVFKSDANGMATKFGQYMFQIQNGGRKLIWPTALAEAKPQVPYTGQ
jgi:branched-chain amino acid transport system substrate-binding protein